MFAITGITGNVGGEVARNLLAAGQPVRAVVRDLTKGETWSKSGCSLAAADIDPAAYGQPVHHETVGTVPERDAFEMEIPNLAVAQEQRVGATGVGDRKAASGRVIDGEQHGDEAGFEAATLQTIV